jgi:hypothetical protein
MTYLLDYFYSTLDNVNHNTELYGISRRFYQQNKTSIDALLDKLARAPVPLQALPSTIGFGRGCFATKDIKRGEIIGGYTGKPAFHTDRNKGDKVLRLVTPSKITFYVKGTNILSYMQHSKTRQNAILDPNGFARALHNIRDGDEVFIDYGVQYWRYQILNMSDDFYYKIIGKNREAANIVNLVCKSMVDS